VQLLLKEQTIEAQVGMQALPFLGRWVDPKLIQLN
jgi:hypothetical protein